MVSPAPDPPADDLVALARQLQEATARVLRAAYEHRPCLEITELVDVALEELAARRSRSSAFPSQWFGEAAWDIVLDLYVHRCLRRKVSVSSACVAADVPTTTALRWIANLERENWIERIRAPYDRRVWYVVLNETRIPIIERWLDGRAHVRGSTRQAFNFLSGNRQGAI